MARRREGGRAYREGETRHETALLEPEDGSERAREEDALDGGERDQAFTKDGPVVRDPPHSPVGFLLDAGDCAKW